MGPQLPTSAALQGLIAEMTADHVSLGWILDRLGERSFGLLMLILALLALVSGLSSFIGVLIMLPAMQMILARPHPVLPRIVARRRLRTKSLVPLIERTMPLLRRVERLIRPRWPTPFEATKRVVGAVILLLAVTLVSPIPFTHVIPCLAIVLIALAYLEEDGLVLCIALAAATGSLAVTTATTWGAVAGIEFLDRL
jgi:hypothetical protein